MLAVRDNLNPKKTRKKDREVKAFKADNEQTDMHDRERAGGS